MLKIALSLVKIYVLVEKGYKRIIALGSSKTFCCSASYADGNTLYVCCFIIDEVIPK